MTAGVKAAAARARGRMAYLALEAPREGLASYAHVYEIVEGLRRRGYAVDMFVPRYSKSADPVGIARRLWEYVWLQSALFWGWHRYDMIYVRGHNMAFPVGLLAKLTGKPIVHEVNGPHLDITVTHRWTRYFDRPLRWMQRSQYLWASALVAVTPQLEAWLRREGCKNAIEVIPNGANLALFNPDRERRPGLPERYVVFFGGFARWQGIPIMIEAASDPAWPAGIALVIVGDGQLASDVRAAAAKNRNIHYLGKLPYADVGAVVAGALAGLVPKTRDDDSEKTGLFPVKLFEIMACGTPAVVSDYPGQADLVRTAQCGVVVPPENPKALASAVATITVDESERKAMGARGHALVVKEHSWDARAEQTARLMASVIDPHARADAR